jgi:deoxyribonuclease-4
MSAVTAPAPTITIDPALARAGLAGRRVGPHLPIRDGLLRTAARAEALGASALQVFTDDPKAWAPRTGDLVDVDLFRALLEASDILLLVHASYLVNLASPDPDVHARSTERMRREMAAAAELGARAVNVHVGSHRGAGVAAGVERVGEAIARIVDPDAGRSGPLLVLETSAGQGDSLGVSIEELAAVIDAAERRGIDRARLGVCLDTAHLWSAGSAVDDPLVLDALLASIDATLGDTALAMVHLNDARVAMGSRQDRHEHLGDGRIGGLGLGHLARHPRLIDVPMLLETPGLDGGWDAVDMARVRAYLAHEPGAAGVLPRSDMVPAAGVGGACVHIPGSPPEHA